MENKTQHTKTVLTAELKNICENTYYDFAPSDSPVPRISYAFREISAENHQSQYVLEFDLWDKETYLNIDNLADSIENNFDFSSHLDGNLLIVLHKDGDRQSIIDEDKRIRHIKMRFGMTVIERG